MKVYSTLTRHRPCVSLLAGLLVGLAAQQATAAADVVVVRGGEAAAAAQARRESLQETLMEYVRTMHEEMRSTLEDSLRQRPRLELQLQLATQEISTRG